MKNKKNAIKNSLIAIHVFFALVGLCIYLINYNLSENLLLQRVLNKEQTIAKAGSLSIEGLFTTVQSELNSFVFSFTKVNDFSVIDINNIRQGFMSFIQRAQLPINGIAYYDQTGKLIAIENRQNLHIGEDQDFSKTEYILWSKNPDNKNKIYISTPYIGVTGGSVGKVILIFLKPIYFGNTYKGALSIRILVDDLRKAFINPLVSDPSEDSFIVDSNGVLIAGKSNLLNKNLYKYAQKQKWAYYSYFISTLKKAIKTNNTEADWFFQNPGESSKELLVGGSEIDLPNTDKDLFLIVTTQKSNTLSLLGSLRSYGYFWLGFSFIITVIGSFLVIYLKDSLS